MLSAIVLICSVTPPGLHSR